MLALALLDGWGEQWQHIAATAYNAGLMAAASQGAKVDDLYRSPHDMRRRFAWVDENEQQEQQPQDLEKLKASLAAMFGA